MKYRIITCKNHPELRWTCEDTAWSNAGYNGKRIILFLGVPNGKGMFQDGSGLDCTDYLEDGQVIEECPCDASNLILAPEDALVIR